MSKNLDVEIVGKIPRTGRMRSPRTVTASVMIADCEFEVKVGRHNRYCGKVPSGCVIEIGDWRSPAYISLWKSLSLLRLKPGWPRSLLKRGRLPIKSCRNWLLATWTTTSGSSEKCRKG